MKFEIKNRYTGLVIFSCDLSAEVAGQSYSLQLGFAVREAVKARADLSAANLSAADLSAADLRYAYLRDADLRYAYLRDADLRAANLRDADLSAADLRYADLSAANLRDADLSDADLRYADLSDANLSAADLSDADLRAADLRDANLSAADLSDANLRAADLSAANLTPIRDDFWAVLSAAPKEVDGLRLALAEGRVNGSTYTGECACLVGTIAKIRGENFEHLGILKPNASRPIERFFMAIRRGDTPETNQVSRIVLGWLDEWVGNMREAFGK